MRKHWRLIEADLQEVYGLDVESPIMRRRTWRWLRIRILALMDRPPTFIEVSSKDGKRLVVVPSTRLGYALDPPTFDSE
jgi:hypothetical protein